MEGFREISPPIFSLLSQPNWRLEDKRTYISYRSASWSIYKVNKGKNRSEGNCHTAFSHSEFIFPLCELIFLESAIVYPMAQQTRRLLLISVPTMISTTFFSQTFHPELLSILFMKYLCTCCSLLSLLLPFNITLLTPEPIIRFSFSLSFLSCI